MFLKLFGKSAVRSLNNRWISSTRIFSTNDWSRSTHNMRLTQSPTVTSHEKSSQYPTTGTFIVMASIMSIFKKKEEETPEEKMISIIKHSILCIQKGELEKAEQMLHIGLKMAQDLNNRDGVTYIYDVMANLAMEARQFVKAEKLFANVMQRLFQDGYKENDIKMLHVSAKLAHMAGLQGQFDKAVTGFRWTLEKIDSKLKELERDEELLELWGLTKNWYGQLLMQFNHFAEAQKCFLDSYKVYTDLHGKLTEDALMLLNNLAVACTNLDEMKKAEEYLNEAINLAKQIPDMVDQGIYQANLGFLYFKQGMLKEAKETCSMAWRLGMQFKSADAVDQANMCLEQIEKWKAEAEAAKPKK